MNNKFCPNCGAPLKEGEMFCSNCGSKIDNSNVQNVNTSNITNTTASNTNANTFSNMNTQMPQNAMNNTANAQMNTNKSSFSNSMKIGIAITVIAVILVITLIVKISSAITEANRKLPYELKWKYTTEKIKEEYKDTNKFGDDGLSLKFDPAELGLTESDKVKYGSTYLSFDDEKLNYISISANIKDQEKKDKVLDYFKDKYGSIDEKNEGKDSTTYMWRKSAIDAFITLSIGDDYVSLSIIKSDN
ncbi:zinc ribbon domain-containing protein [Butyrivibrio sp. NC3005]|uniref:zinc ribbon domain-containing protein n=1 Tax=Butyrivibrio sp. NC3005 TaxID=1280685 RepID=UPI000405600D|nr:zinc ribbon domain-containing protein [Butyrivibrio sp. NC3005]